MARWQRHSHLQATLLGPSLTVPIAEGKLVLGTWQQIFHLECDVRGRQRTVVITVVGDEGTDLLVTGIRPMPDLERFCCKLWFHGDIF